MSILQSDTDLQGFLHSMSELSGTICGLETHHTHMFILNSNSTQRSKLQIGKYANFSRTNIIDERVQLKLRISRSSNDQWMRETMDACQMC